MYSEPCVRFTKLMMPNTSVSPAASKNNSTPYCTPLSSWDKTSVVIHYPLWDTVNVDRSVESVASAHTGGRVTRSSLPGAHQVRPTVPQTGANLGPGVAVS